MYIHTYICMYIYTVFRYDVTDIIDCVLNTKRGVLTLVGDIRRYRNDRYNNNNNNFYYYYYFYYNNKLPFCLVSLPFSVCLSGAI